MSIMYHVATVLCPARATHGADLRAVCGRFHRNLDVCIHLEEQDLLLCLHK